MTMLNGTDPALLAQLRQEHADAVENLISKHSEHHERPDVEAALAQLLRPTERGAADEALRRERANRNARTTVDREEAEAGLRLPPERDSYTLASYLDEPREARIERVESLQRESHRTLLVAAYKTGKTRLHANLTRSLTEGSQFLGRFAVKRPRGRVGVWNAEMEDADYESYLRDAGVTQSDRVAIWNLRGYRVPLTSDAAADAATAWLRDNDVAYWIIDPWSRLCSWAGVDENVNAEVGTLLQRVDEIANDAGVGEVLIVHHAGHLKGRPRGATVLPDWADGIWMYTRDEESDRRYLRVEGRGVELAEGLVEIDDDGRAVYREVSRRAAKLKGLVDEFVAFVAANPGCTIGNAKASLDAGNKAKDDAAAKAIKLGMVRKEDDPDDRRSKLLYYESAEPVGGLLV